MADYNTEIQYAVFDENGLATVRDGQRCTAATR